METKTDACLEIVPGRVYWITGLSGAGKTTIATALFKLKKTHMSNLVLLDGDELRATVANEFGYSKEERIAAAMRYAKICALLSKKGIHVIIATISMYHEVREWNRLNISDYLEIYLKVPMDVLKIRNQKNLYSDADNGRVRNVAGVDLNIEEPKNPDLVIINDGKFTVAECVRKIMDIEG